MMSVSISLAAFKVNAGGESITSYETINEPGIAEAFWRRAESNLYMVCLAKKRGELRDIKGGIAILTSLTHHDRDFQDAIMSLIRSSTVLKPVSEKSNMSLLPAKLSIEGEIPTEDELRNVFSGNILNTVVQVAPE
ncbi:hypothetical protein ACFQUX_01765 [Pantoea stewartii]